MSSRISVVIPCYNSAEFLRQALESVRAQTRTSHEIIVVDDASSDDSVAIARSTPGVRVIELPENRGVSVARNTGWRAASGDLIAMLDADDHWEADHLEIVAGLLDRFPEPEVAFGLVRQFGIRNAPWPALLPHETPVDALAASLARVVAPHNALVVRRTALEAIGGYAMMHRRAEDYDLLLRLAARAPFVLSHRVTAWWRQHAANISSGGLPEYWAVEYESRRQFRDAMSDRLTSAALADLDAQILDVWRNHLDVAWHTRDRGAMAFHLGMHRHVSGLTKRELSAARRRARLMHVLPLWDRGSALLRRAALRTV